MKAEDLFLAIGDVETHRLQRSELTTRTSSAGIEEEYTMKHKKTSKVIRNLLIAAAITAILSVTAYAAVNARIRLETTKFQEEKVVTEPSTGNYDVEIDFQRTTNEYLELGSVYPQSVPEGYTISFVSDSALGMQHIVYANENGEDAIRFIAQLGSEGGQLELQNVTGEETVTIQECPGTLYRNGGGGQAVIWYNETQGIGYTLLTQIPNLDVDLIAIAQSVGTGEALTPTLSAGYDTALSELGDYRITALPEGFVETDFMAAPLETGGGWYAYVRRWYGDKVTTDNTLHFEYEHFQLESDEPENHAEEPVENVPETILRYAGGGEPATIQGMPGAVSDGAVHWVDWDAQVVFSLYGNAYDAEALTAMAESVQRFN